ncbi:MAG: response regulator [Candidatus Zapsychrus exili]|nr:response regulator [Candidatus Zapsychrus exili]
MQKILVVDDDQDLSGIIKSVLEYEGYTVFVANDAQKGINIAEEQSPNLILLDIVMPGMDGSEAVSVLKSKESTKDIPVVFLTGLMSDEDENSGVDGINIGGVYHQALAKPFENVQLIELVKKSLQQIGN